MPRYLIVLLTLILVACSAPSAPEPTATSVPESEAAAAEQPAEPALPTTDIPATNTPVEATLPPTAVAQAEPTPTNASAPTEAPATEAPVTEAPATEAPAPEAQFNGQNPDGTFFRGFSTAPLTLIDYSDFL